MAVISLCAVKMHVGNWNIPRAHVSEISAYRRTDKRKAEERRYFGYMCGQLEKARHGVHFSVLLDMRENTDHRSAMSPER